MQFEDIYRLEVVSALEHDHDLDFKDIGDKYLQKGICPGCGERTLYIARKQPYQLKCNRLNQCQHEEKTRERYSYLFENLSERFPRTDLNPNATADAYLQRNRGFDISKMKGWYEQARRQMPDGQWADTVRFPLCNGYWERIIDATMVKANGGDKAGIKKGMSYRSGGWIPPGMAIESGDNVYIVEGIFHAIALHLAGYKVIASISANNFPWGLDDHSTESVGGIKTIEALGAIKLLSGGSASLAAVDDLHQATGRDLNLVVGQKYSATVGGDMQERIEGLRKSVAGVSQRLEAPKTWIGSSGVNALQVLCDLLDLVEQMNTQLAGHKHVPTPPPDNAGEFTGNAASALLLSGKLKPITG